MPDISNDILMMKRCLQLAKLGCGRVAPNPMVGCVIAVDNRILSEGYHRQFGQAHAEVNALNGMGGKPIPPEATLYVNLEPCCHYGKTPPCAQRIIKEGIKRVVICNTDPNPKVAGGGIALLRQAGICVESGLLEEEGWILNRKFFTFHKKKRPFITLKWAESADGFIDGNGEHPVQISHQISKALVHKLRAENQALLVGKQTALKDNPTLHTRRWYGKQVLRLCIDRNLQVPSTHHLYDGSQATRIYNALKNDNLLVKLNFEQDIIPQILNDLYQLGIQSLIVEGGRYTLEQFIAGGWYDEVQIERGQVVCHQGTPAPHITLPPHYTQSPCGKHQMIHFYHF